MPTITKTVAASTAKFFQPQRHGRPVISAAATTSPSQSGRPCGLTMTMSIAAHRNGKSRATEKLRAGNPSAVATVNTASTMESAISSCSYHNTRGRIAQMHVTTGTASTRNRVTWPVIQPIATTITSPSKCWRITIPCAVLPGKSGITSSMIG